MKRVRMILCIGIMMCMAISVCYAGESSFAPRIATQTSIGEGARSFTSIEKSASNFTNLVMQGSDGTNHGRYVMKSSDGSNSGRYILSSKDTSTPGIFNVTPGRESNTALFSPEQLNGATGYIPREKGEISLIPNQSSTITAEEWKAWKAWQAEDDSHADVGYEEYLQYKEDIKSIQKHYFTDLGNGSDAGYGSAFTGW